MKKQIDLTAGFLVDDYRGYIKKVTYVEIPFETYGSVEQKYLILDEKGTVIVSGLSKFSGDKVFDKLCDAKSHAREIKKSEVKRLKKNIEGYTEELKKLEKTLI